MDITYLELLYIVLTVFFIAVGTMLTLVLIKVNRILGTVNKVTGYVEKVTLAFGAYKQVPDIVKDKVKNLFKK